MSIDLPISKSIVNRILMLQAIHGVPLMEVDSDMPEDTRLLHDVLAQIIATTSTISHSPQKAPYHLLPTTYNLHNCGTALRFLTAYCATQKGLCVILDGSPRLRKRPIGQLVDCLHDYGAMIQYMGEPGYPPLYIFGGKLNRHRHYIRMDNPLSSQMVSALLLVGLPVQTNCHSPYIEMTKSLIATYPLSPLTSHFEADWSAAAFWYEYIALHGGELQLNGLRQHSLQGDQRVAQLFRPLGVDTIYTDTGIRIARTREVNMWPSVVNFQPCPDLYPAVKMTYLQLGKPLIALGTSSLRYKESDRLAAFSTLYTLHPTPYTTHHDHRIAMALLAADLPCDDTDCISKSYPRFVEQLKMQNAQCTIDFTTIIPRKGINDDNLGKKHALHQLIAQATTPYVWLQDDDVLPSPLTSHLSPINLPPADLYILPLRMQGGDSLLERLQIAEYAAIQQVTMQTAKRGRAVMCSGANLLVNRQRWLESYDDLHVEIPSGDDMFLLESFRRRGLKIIAIDRADVTATVAAAKSWRELLRQRMRWAGKAPHYTDPYIRRYGAMIVLVNMLQLFFPPLLLLKFPIEYRLIKKRDPKVSFSVALLLEIVYPYYMLLCILGGLLRRSW